MFLNPFLQHRVQQSGGRCYVDEIAGHPTHLIEGGKGDAVLLWIPAFGDPASNFIAPMLALSTKLLGRATIVAADPPGFGNSPAKGGVPGFREACIWAGHLIERLARGGRRIVVSGNSSGAALAIGGAVRRPASVVGAILVCWPDWRFGRMPRSDELCPTDLASLRRLLERSWHAPPQIPAAMARILIHRLSHPDYRKHVDSFDAHEGSAQLQHYEGPLAFIGGRSDGLVPPRVLEASAEARPDSILRWIDACGHYPHRERCKQLVDLLAELTQGFLDPFSSNSSEGSAYA